MGTIKQILIDSLNGFSFDQIPLFLFQLLAAGLMAHLLQIIINKKYAEVIITNAVLYAVGIAIMASIVKYSVPFAVLGASLVFILFRTKETNVLSSLMLFLICLIGFGCGVGSVVQTGLGYVLILGLIMFIPVKK